MLPTPIMSEYHVPIMVSEVVKGLQVAPGKLIIDVTVGGGGHTAAILKAGSRVIGLDADLEALEATKQRLRHEFPDLKEGKDWKVLHGNFRDVKVLVMGEGVGTVDGILFDLGVSSHQLDEATRGFSYRFSGAPLDLRLNQGEGQTAAELLQTITEQDLYEILATYGEEELSRPISVAIVRARAVNPITTTGALLTIIKGVAGDHRAQAVASRVFQALRIAVNDELVSLKEGLNGAVTLLKPGGRLAVISFHSLEDRIVKRYLKSDAWKLITKKPVNADEKEIQKNRRARSAKLRIAEKL